MADRTPLPTTGAAAPYAFHAHANGEVWTWAAAVSIAAELRRELIQHPRARLLLSGGGTPGPVYRALSQAPLDWDRVDVGLVDERWLLPDDPDSNAWLVHREFLRDHAATARFEPMTQPGRNIEGAVATANAHARRQAAVAVFGMGEDGHTASLFPGMDGLDRILASPRDYVAIDAKGCPGARQWPRRISLTPNGIARIPHRLLLIQGERKRAVFEQALASGDPHRWPVLVLLESRHATALDVHWCV
ncbi:6-phosphogluconolactonase [Lysobacter changpingensis]|jgi:6-phosphogluconolactonase|uniref:6-phosphogluconolactonase n=1 Tax=Lysobacter changpingensis TaxID=2792784 RepID=UPI001A8E1FD2|nr:6-phosphogluconolactonase [Lysobacter changpingensis]